MAKKQLDSGRLAGETDSVAEDAVQYEPVSQIRIPTISGKIVGILQVLVPEIPILGLAW